MNRTGFKSRGKGFTAQRNPMNKVSAKKATYRRSEAGLAGLAHMGKVKRLPCVVCGAFGVDAHHCFHGRYGNRKVPDFDTIPLCRNCHLDGQHAIHREKQSWRERHGPDHSYIKATREAVSALGD